MSNYDLLFHCAPTLANLKIGNLFTVKFDSITELEEKVKKKNELFSEKGLCIHILRKGQYSALIYVYRIKKLKEALNNSDIQVFLKEFGLDHPDIPSAIQQLEQDLQEKDFPHYIGAFLGYPLEDIRGFILHQGKNCHYTGVWKVYHDPETAIKLFQQYKKCVDIYLKRYAQGFDMNRLTVAG